MLYLLRRIKNRYFRKKLKCKLCGKKMGYDDAPSTGWGCKCGYSKDDNGMEWLNEEPIICEIKTKKN